MLDGGRRDIIQRWGDMRNLSSGIFLSENFPLKRKPLLFWLVPNNCAVNIMAGHDCNVSVTGNDLGL